MFELWVAIGSLSALALVFGLLLGYASRRFAVEGNPVVDQIDDILPQSQCAE
jgi:electron transport complex protein RnfB